jgi:membrane dipeptidase
MRSFFVKSALVLVAFSVCQAIAGHGTSATEEQDSVARARRIHAETIGVDSHIDTLQRVLNGKEDISRRTGKGHVDLPRLREAGMRAPFFALYVPTYYKGSEAVRRTLQLRDAMQSLLDAHPDQIELALSVSDIERIAKTGKIAAVLTIESGHAIVDNLAVLRMYHRLGVRSMTLSHFRNTNWADSSTDTPVHNGLTDFGRDVVREMNRLGMIVDISHVSDKAFYDTLAVTSKPVIASHSSCRALTDVPRNMTDDMIRALARNGGVIGINFGGSFLSQKEVEASRKNFAARAAVDPGLTGQALDEFATKDYLDTYSTMRPNLSTLRDAVAHIDHVVKLVGVDHVGIGSDWDGISTVPAGLEHVSRMPVLTAALLQQATASKT